MKNTKPVLNELTILGEPRRQHILKLVWDHDHSAGEIAATLPDISFGAVSQHLSILVGGGLVTVRKQGRSRIYRANRGHMGPIEDYLTAFWGHKLAKFKTRMEEAEKADDEKENIKSDKSNKDKTK